MQTYGTLTSQLNNTKIVYSTTTTNGTSNTTLAGQIVTVQTCDWANITTYAPALNSAYPSDSTMLATTVEIQQMPGQLAQITTTYTSTATALPSTTYNEQSSQIEVPIQEHPNFGDWAADWDSDNQRFIDSSDKAGIASYIKGTTTVTVTSYYTSKPTDDRSSIGKIQSPGGDYSESNQWLLVGANRSKQGATWVMQKTYLYSATEWNSDIYS